MQRAFSWGRRVGVGPLARFGSILLVFFAVDSFAAGDAPAPAPAQARADKDVMASPAAASDISDISTSVLPLDHGPRATTTPWLNQQRRLKAAAAASAARASSAATSATAAPTPP